MQSKNSRKPLIDADLWSKVCANKHSRNLAEKAERIGREADTERRELFALALKTWAKHTPLRQHFPNTKDFCTADAIYRLCYCNKVIRAGEWQDVDGAFSKINEAAYEGRTFARFVANQVLKNAPIDEIIETIHALTRCCKATKLDKKKNEAPKKDEPRQTPESTDIGKESRIVLRQLNAVDPRFSITPDGKLRITRSREGEL